MNIQNTNSILSINNNESDTYQLIRSSIFYYLQVTDDEKNIFNASSSIRSKPSIIFYQSDSDINAILDFTNASTTDKKYLDILFSNLNDFSGITLSNAIYLDEKVGIQNKSLNCSLLFRKYTNNILVSKVISSIDSGDLNVLFDGDYFVDTPSITSTSWEQKTATNNSLLISLNSKTENTFSSRYIQPGDLVEIINPNSNNNNNKFEILEFLNINDKEVIKLKTKAINESLLGSPTVINFYAKTKIKNTSQNLFDNNITGCCLNTQTNQSYDNTTEYECYIRTEGNYRHVKSQSCSTVSSSATSTTINIFDYAVVNKFFITTRETPSVVFDVNINISALVNEILLTVKSGSFNVLQNNVLYLNPDKLYSFEQTTTNNYKKILRFSTTKETLTPYLDGVFGVINENALNTIHYLRTTNSTPTLYLFTQDEPNLSSSIEIRVSPAV